MGWLVLRNCSVALQHGDYSSLLTTPSIATHSLQKSWVVDGLWQLEQ